MPARRWPSDTTTGFGVDRSRARSGGGALIGQPPDDVPVVADLTLDLAGVVAGASGAAVPPALELAEAPGPAAASGAGVAPALAEGLAPTVAAATGAAPAPVLSESVGVPAGGGSGGAPAVGIALAFGVPAAAGSAVAVPPTLSSASTLDLAVPAAAATGAAGPPGVAAESPVPAAAAAAVAPPPALALGSVLSLAVPAASVDAVAVPPGLDTGAVPAPAPPALTGGGPGYPSRVWERFGALDLDAPAAAVRVVAVAPGLSVTERPSAPTISRLGPRERQNVPQVVPASTGPVRENVRLEPVAAGVGVRAVVPSLGVDESRRHEEELAVLLSLR